MLFGSRLQNADRMFRRYFDHWYDDVERDIKGFRWTRPDLLRKESLIGLSAEEITPVDERLAAEALRRVEGMYGAAANDWRTFLDLELPVDIRWIDLCDRHHDRRKVKELVRSSDPKEFANDYLVSVCEFGAVLGHVLKDLLPRLQWVPSWPYWESSLFDSETGNIIPVFHWAIKKFSTYGIDDGYAAKLRACVANLEKERAAGVRGDGGDGVVGRIVTY